VSEDFLHKIFSAIEQDPQATFTINLEQQQFTIDVTGQSTDFEIDAYKKHCLLNGQDDIDFLLSIKDKIETYEQQRQAAAV
jgi:3-isopropylmalate/(R)-2-methylmalate dehydratase small subunit